MYSFFLNKMNIKQPKIKFVEFCRAHHPIKFKVLLIYYNRLWKHMYIVYSCIYLEILELRTYKPFWFTLSCLMFVIQLWFDLNFI